MRLVAERLARGGPARVPERERQIVAGAAGLASSDIERRRLEAVLACLLAEPRSQAAHGLPPPRELHIGPAVLGGPTLLLIAGPFVVEDASRASGTARTAHEAGAGALLVRARTARGLLDAEGLGLWRAASARSGLALLVEASDPPAIASAAQHADALLLELQAPLGAQLLRPAATASRPVLLAGAQTEALCASVELLRAAGCEAVALSLHSAGPGTATDPAACACAARRLGAPVAVDPSDSSAPPELLAARALAAVAAGVDGLILPVREAATPGPGLSPGELAELAATARALRAVLRLGG